MKKEHTIDAKNQKLGRVASQASAFLIGKDNPSFQKNVVEKVEVKIINASQLDIGQDKMKNKEYKRYSGHPGGLKSETMEKVLEKKGYEEILRKAVMGMLPKNKLRSEMMKNLKVID